MTRWRPYLSGERTSFTYYPNSAAVGLVRWLRFAANPFRSSPKSPRNRQRRVSSSNKGGAHGGHLLFIDEHAVGALRDVEIHPGTFGLAGASLSIGRNGGSAVSSDYPAPYPFTGGTIAQVVVDISGEDYENLEKKLSIAFAKD
ncbi:Arylsulfatase [Mycobacteroides abscessus subsp. massiliense]|nr:Arylsulfatase [Mycobacteroides abscessus subsp. massiliense]